MISHNIIVKPETTYSPQTFNGVHVNRTQVRSQAQLDAFLELAPPVDSYVVYKTTGEISGPWGFFYVLQVNNDYTQMSFDYKGHLKTHYIINCNHACHAIPRWDDILEYRLLTEAELAAHIDDKLRNHLEQFKANRNVAKP